MIDKHDRPVVVFGEPTPLQQFLPSLRLDRSKLEARYFLSLQDENHRPVAQIAHAVEQDYFAPFDSFMADVTHTPVEDCFVMALEAPFFAVTPGS